jgi:hypothetical protein
LYGFSLEVQVQISDGAYSIIAGLITDNRP